MNLLNSLFSNNSQYLLIFAISVCAFFLVQKIIAFYKLQLADEIRQKEELQRALQLQKKITKAMENETANYTNDINVTLKRLREKTKRN